MALETLAGIKKIGGFQTEEIFPHGERRTPEKGIYPIIIDHTLNGITFFIQNGPIKESGLNGCQVDTIIEAAKTIIEGLNKKFPCRENSMMITKLDEALHWSLHRKMDREKRNVEGTSQA